MFYTSCKPCNFVFLLLKSISLPISTSLINNLIRVSNKILHLQTKEGRHFFHARCTFLFVFFFCREFGEKGEGGDELMGDLSWGSFGYLFK